MKSLEFTAFTKVINKGLESGAEVQFDGKVKVEDAVENTLFRYSGRVNLKGIGTNKNVIYEFECDSALIRLNHDFTRHINYCSHGGTTPFISIPVTINGGLGRVTIDSPKDIKY